MNEKEELKSCPFCGNGNVVSIGVEDMTTDIYCPLCEAAVVWRGDSKFFSVDAWNRRAPSLSDLEKKVIEAAMNLNPSCGTWEKELRMDYDEVQIDKRELKAFRSAVAALRAAQEKR